MAQPYTPRNTYRESYYEFMVQQTGWKQARPRTDPLPYQVENYHKTLESGWVGERTSWQFASQNFNPLGVYANGEKIRAYDRFLDKLGPRAELGVNLVEARQALGMMTNRLLQILQFGRRLKRLDLIGAARELKLAAVPKKVSTHKSFANNWLEFHFGWAPLVNDIAASVDVLQAPLPSARVVGASSGFYSRTVKSPLGDPYPCNGNTWREKRYTISTGLVKARYQAYVAIENPNLYLANALGFVNPVGLAWEVVPFSFVVDWFVNTNQFMKLGSDLLGLQVLHPQTATWKTGVVDTWVHTPQCNVPLMRSSWACMTGVRETGLATPNLGFRKWKLPGWERALTASSLLVQFLKR